MPKFLILKQILHINRQNVNRSLNEYYIYLFIRLQFYVGYIIESKIESRVQDYRIGKRLVKLENESDFENKENSFGPFCEKENKSEA